MKNGHFLLYNMWTTPHWRQRPGRPSSTTCRLQQISDGGTQRTTYEPDECMLQRCSDYNTTAIIIILILGFQTTTNNLPWNLAFFAKNRREIWHFPPWNRLSHTCMVMVTCVCVWLIDNNNSKTKIVPLEKGVVTYGANALSLLRVVLFMSSILAYCVMLMCDFFPFAFISQVS